MMLKKFNKILEFICPKDVIAITLYPFGIYYRKQLTKIDINHELIHWKQQKEMLVIFFYLWYLVEYIFRGYYNISFEQEAYKNQNNLIYIKTRKIFSWIKYL